MIEARIKFLEEDRQFVSEEFQEAKTQWDKGYLAGVKQRLAMEIWFLNQILKVVP